MISYKEYKTQKETEHRASTTDKFTPKKGEDWDAEPSCQLWETPPGAHSMAPSQEDEWKLMIDQDPHGTMTITTETESTKEVKQLIEAVGGLT